MTLTNKNWVMSYSPENINQCFEEHIAYIFRIKAKNQHGAGYRQTSPCCLLHGFLCDFAYLAGHEVLTLLA
jgi:hypothetical protein